MTARVVRPADLGAADLARWGELQRTAGLSSPFLSPTFTRAVGAVRDEARVAVIEDGAATTGFFAFEQCRFQMARPIGAGVSDGQGVVAAAPTSIENVLAACDLRSYDYDHLVPDQAGATAERHPALFVEMDEGFEPYLEQRRAASKRVKKVAQQRRKIERELGPLVLDPGPHPDAELQRLLRWKSEQYRRTGRPDVFSESWVGELIRGLLATPQPDCHATLWVLRAGDHPVGSSLTLRAGEFSSGWVQAYAPELASYSPGWHLLLSLLEAEAARGVRLLDLGRGVQPYKESLATGTSYVAEGTAAAPGAVGRALALRREPRRRAEAFVLERPALRRAARRALREVGRVRTGG